ncbi:hypothetical protein E3E11_06560 [Oecophyllibacter saccharovorans]|nr:hypothetical protein E3E11_06560 [Oecophyllibacter saccharovorans]
MSFSFTCSPLKRRPVLQEIFLEGSWKAAGEFLPGIKGKGGMLPLKWDRVQDFFENLPVIFLIAHPNIITLILLVLDLLVGLGTYNCVKRKGFGPVSLWVVVCVVMWPCLAVLELCHSRKAEKSAPTLMEYTLLGLTLGLLLFITICFFVQAATSKSI